MMIGRGIVTGGGETDRRAKVVWIIVDKTKIARETETEKGKRRKVEIETEITRE